VLDIAGLHLRAALLRAIRSFFASEGFLEVDTPIRQPVIIPEKNIQPIAASGQYLQSSPELCMKRLLALGCPKIFQLCPCFRGNERGRYHLEEFLMLEWYRLDSDYCALMDDCRALLHHIHDKLVMTGKLHGLEREKFFTDVDLYQPWQRLTVADAFHRYCPLTVAEALRQDRFEEMVVEHIEPYLGRGTPLFLFDYPIELGSLARRSDKSPEVAERFELYINGIELANGFSELTDASEQRQRFASELAAIQAHKGAALPMPERFLDDLGKIDQAAGIALGVDRLFMVMMQYDTIEQAVSFSRQDFL
jgi:lysyl-tRNA synthetase class 2